MVTKADSVLSRTRPESDVAAALQLNAAGTDGWSMPVQLLSCLEGQGIDALIEALAEHAGFLSGEGRLEARATPRPRPGSLRRCARSSAGTAWRSPGAGSTA